MRGARQLSPVPDSWIAATAIANHMAIASGDGGYDEVPGLLVIRV
ncbi:MAG: hypothetical protein ACYDB3_05570 [Acidimicrobiales bacterium]